MYRTTPNSSRFSGWFNDQVTPAAKLYLNGTLVLTVAGNDLTCADTLTVTGTSLLTGVPTIGGAYTLPVAKGSAGQQLQTDGSAVGSWAAAS